MSHKANGVHRLNLASHTFSLKQVIQGVPSSRPWQGPTEASLTPLTLSSLAGEVRPGRGRQGQQRPQGAQAGDPPTARSLRAEGVWPWCPELLGTVPR